jgi:ubiquitin C-terminal hydrolase
MNQIEKMNPLFKQGQAGDSKDFIIYILEQLHKELKKSVAKKNSNKKKNKQQLNQYDKKNVFKDFFDDFQKECSIISDLFFGFNETTNECLNCKNDYNMKGLNNPIWYNYGIFNCIIFPLEEVKKMRNNSNGINYINNNQNNIVSLYDCFVYNQKTEHFSQDNKNYCNICKQLCDSLYTTKIFISPNILILILNRGKGNIYDVKLNFDENIDITDFVIQKDTPRIIYNLYGVITHIGQSGPNAHFVASCKSPIDNKWYRFNDALINPITNVQKEVIEFGTPYILFYQRNRNN